METGMGSPVVECAASHARLAFHHFGRFIQRGEQNLDDPGVVREDFAIGLSCLSNTVYTIRQ